MKTMNNSPEKGFYWKLYIIIAMTAVICFSMGYLIFSGSTDKLQDVLSGKNNSAAALTASPTASSAAKSTASPTAAVSASPAPSASAAASDVTTNTSVLKIVNKTHLLDQTYVPSDLVIPSVSQNHTQYLRKDAASALEKMFAAADQAGIHLYLISGYRSYTEQTSLYYTYLNRNGKDYVNSIDCIPGASEHQLGLSVDVGTADQSCELQNCFETTSEYQWLVKHAPEYGYIFRYPEGKQDVTGIVFSPWAIRYIGEDAVKVNASGKALEEYYSLK